MRSTINAARDRAFSRMLADYPGTIEFIDDPAPAPLDCAVRISVMEREAEDGGFARVRSATVYIAKHVLPEHVSLETRPLVIIYQTGNQPERFRLFESHEQSENHWLLRCAQFDR